MLRNFSWVIPDKLAGLAMVGRLSPLDADARALADHGVTLLVTLTAEVVAPDIIRSAGIEPMHIPVRDFGAPAPGQLDEFVARAEAEITDGGAVAVHCFAGMGRTGTFLAAYLAAAGHGGQEAIRAIRVLRPGSIETLEQERAILDFASSRA